MYSSCPSEGSQNDMHKYAKHNGLGSTVNLVWGACTHDGQRELADTGPYAFHGTNHLLQQFPGGAEDWQNKHGITCPEARQQGLRYDKVFAKQMTITPGDVFPDI